LIGAGSLDVGRALHLTPGHSADAAITVQGARRQDAFQIAHPCPCDDASQLDIPAIVRQAHLQNDNAELQLQPDALKGAFLTTLGEVPCGRFALDGVQIGIGTIIVEVPKRTALFIDGDFIVSTGTLVVNLADSGELDVFITGNLIITGSAVFGTDERPSALRFYVAGQTMFNGIGQFAAQLYAPHGLVSLTGDTDLHGSIVANDIYASGTQRFHYDRAILEAGECDEAPAACSDCAQCPNELTCIAGSCNPCLRDADCCQPLVCNSGACQPL
jgi:hypothetical protein